MYLLHLCPIQRKSVILMFTFKNQDKKKNQTKQNQKPKKRKTKQNYKHNKNSPRKSLTAQCNVECINNRYSDDKMLNRCTLYMNKQHISIELCNKQGVYFYVYIYYTNIRHSFYHKEISDIVFIIKKYLFIVWNVIS